MLGEFYREIIDAIQEERAQVAAALIDGRCGGDGLQERYMVGQIKAFDVALKAVARAWQQKEDDA